MWRVGTNDGVKPRDSFEVNSCSKERDAARCLSRSVIIIEKAEHLPVTPADRFNKVALLVMGAALAGPVCRSPLLLLLSPPSCLPLFFSRPFLLDCQTGVFVFTAASFHRGTIVSWRAFVIKASVFPPLVLPTVT